MMEEGNKEGTNTDSHFHRGKMNVLLGDLRYSLPRRLAS